MSACSEQEREQMEACKQGILHAAKECEDALRLAQFADDEPTLSSGMGASMRKLAGYHSRNAFQWAGRIAFLGGAA